MKLTTGLAHRREVFARPGGMPSWKTLAIVAAIVTTVLLILEFGVWYFVGLIAIYGLLDVAERLELRREARNRAAILAAVGRQVGSIGYVGSRRHCHKAAWLARRLGWIACPIHREGFLRKSVRFRHAGNAQPLSNLLEALHDARLATRIRLPMLVQSYGSRLAEHGLWIEPLDTGIGLSQAEAGDPDAPAFFKRSRLRPEVAAVQHKQIF